MTDINSHWLHLGGCESICQEKNPNSELQSGIKSLASEELGLDIQNIYVDYMDLESFTSNERASK